MKVYIIAEGGSVHDGSLGNAKNLCTVAKKCGADAIKFQIHVAEDETLKNAPNPMHFKEEKRFDYFKRTSFSLKQWKALKKHCDRLKIDFFVSVFSIEALKIAKKLNLKYIKIPSGELTNFPLLKEISKLNHKAILSTGMSNLKEIDSAIKILNKKKVIIMQCTSLYPTQNNQVGLNIISYFKKKYKSCQIGFSDHTNSLASAIGSVILGASFIEKHLTFSKDMYGSDAKYSFEPKNFRTYCAEIRNISEIILNPIDKNNLKNLKKTKKIFEKSIVTKKIIFKNQKFSLENITTKKTGKGISAKFFYKITNKKSNSNLTKNTILEWRHIT
jgi:N-acetylneuraminate synthase